MKRPVNLPRPYAPLPGTSRSRFPRKPLPSVPVKTVRTEIRLSNPRPVAKRKVVRAESRSFATAIMIVIMLVAVFGFPYFLLMLIGMAPTWIGMLTSHRFLDLRHAALMQVNLAGTVPFLAEVVRQGGSAMIAINLLCDPRTWLTMLGSAAAGSALVWLCRQIAFIVVGMMNATRRLDLKIRQASLEEEWGRDALRELEVVR